MGGEFHREKLTSKRMKAPQDDTHPIPAALRHHYIQVIPIHYPHARDSFIRIKAGAIVEDFYIVSCKTKSP
jgi:hypothetical protein